MTIQRQIYPSSGSTATVDSDNSPMYSEETVKSSVQDSEQTPNELKERQQRATFGRNREMETVKSDSDSTDNTLTPTETPTLQDNNKIRQPQDSDQNTGQPS